MQRLKKYLFLSLLIGLFSTGLYAQGVLDQQVDFTVANKDLSTALYELSVQTGINISFGSHPQLTGRTINVKYTRRSLKYILQDLLTSTDLNFKMIGNQIVLFPRPPKPVKRYTIRGFVEDNVNGEKLIAANVYDPDSYRGTSTNYYGFYSLTLPTGKVKLSYSYLGFLTQTHEFDLRKDTMLSISLESDFTLEEVVVIAPDSFSANKFGHISREEIALDQMKKLPALAGEADVLRHTFLLAGVQSGTDGVGGLFVRGGNADQNLVLLDGVPVYNATHLIGIFSIFNSSAIRSASLIKGSFPARYGGRLSSVLDVRTKEGNEKNYEAEIGLGVISGKVTVEGPIVKNKSAFFLSYRRSFLDLIMKPITKYVNRNQGEDGFSAYRFQDFNAKINFPVSKRDELFLSVYAGGDDFQNRRKVKLPLETYKRNQLLNWGNTIASFRWNHDFGNRLFGNTTATFSKYNFESQYFIGIKDNTPDSIAQSYFFANQYQSTIQDLAIKLDFDYFPQPEHYIRFGVHYTRHKFQPRIASVNETNDIGFNFDSNFSTLDQLFGDAFIEVYEGSAYVEDEITILRELRLNIGLHASYFRDGPQTYFSLQPRVSSQIYIQSDWSLNLSFARMRQHLHLLTRSGIGLPADLWVPSTDRIRPQDSWQTVLGLKFVPQSGRTAWQAGVEAYFKKMDHVLAFQEGTLFNFIDGENWEDKVTAGRGWAYGIEFSGSKTKGKTTAIMNATLAWSERQFDELSSGNKFDFRYDRRFFMKLAGVQHISPRFEIAANWVFGTGNGITLPTSVSEYYPSRGFDFTLPYVAVNYGSRNAYRMEAYHRFDFGFNFYFEKPWGSQTLHAGIYNVYNRRNPLYINLQPKEDNPDENEFVKYSLLPMLPQVSYSARIKKWKKKITEEEKDRIGWDE